MKRQIRFTKRSLDALPPCPVDAASKEIEYSDLEIGGLRVQVNRQGRKAFLFRYQIDGRKRAMKVGGYPETSIDEARQQAIEWKAQIAKGTDPQASRDVMRESGITFREFFDQHLWPHIVSTKRSAKADGSRFQNHILPVFGQREMARITTLELQRFHNDKKGEVAVATSNRVFELIRHAFNLAASWGLIPPGVRPCDGIKLHKENNKRERYLDPAEELPRLMKALEAEPSRSAADLFRFLLATGARREEAVQAKWEHISLERRQWRMPMSKSGMARVVILNEMALDILAGRPRIRGNPFVFTGKLPGRPIANPTRAWKRVLKRAGIDPKTTRLHDLRHTHASYLVGVASLHEIAGILGHSNTSTTQRYAHLNDDRLRAASNHVADLMRSAAASS
ncbi:site-specific integrase [Zoogloea sp.]|uniref:tyrosine-type recombinase/integrase n=1 Tax=Zoogloea sp. TaxID=49181 RepID=UPI0014167F5E|nr:MAG: tyrosine-type recombinase/integrase [Zoogloea sp.]